MKATMNSLLVAALVTLAAPALAAGSAQADGPSMVSVRAVKVGYADLDLGNPAGVATLYARLRVAANRSCSSGGQLGIEYRRPVRECREQALQNAIQQVGVVGLAQLHQQDAGPSG